MKLEANRIILREPEPRDARAYFELCNSEFVLKYNAMTPKTFEAVLREFEKLGKEDALVIEHKESGTVIGAIFIHEDSLRWGVNSKELSYFLSEEYSRQGYMKEALHMLIGYLFETEGLVCVAARSFAPNVASRKLLESLGFHNDGVIPVCVKGYGGILYDDTLYSVFKEKWS